MSYDIPEYVFSGLRPLARLNSEQLKVVSKTIKETPITTNPDRLAEHLAKLWMDDSIKFDADTIQALLSLQSANLVFSSEKESFLTDFFEKLKGHSDFKDIPSTSFNEFVEMLTDLIMTDTAFSITAKALDLLSSHGTVILDTKIITDIRPVFSDSSLDSPENAVIFHTLKLSCSEDGIEKTIFLTTNNGGLEKLSKSVERARKKSELLKKWLQAKNVDCLPF